MTVKPKYNHLLKDPRVRRWYENLEAKSYLTATTWLRTLGYYCELQQTNPSKLLETMENGGFRDVFSDFVRRLEHQGKAGSYIKRFKNTLRSFSKYNGKNIDLNVNIKGEHLTPTIEDEKVPSKEELDRILRKATSRGRVAIALMAFAGLRPESLGDYRGTDGLRLRDLVGLSLNDTIGFDTMPLMVSVKSMLSKARHHYFSFLGQEGATYIREYLEERKKKGEILKPESPLLQFDGKRATKNKFLRTTLVTRDIRSAIEGAGLHMRPYVLRAYFSTGLDIAENKGYISHPWRQFIMGHKGDIEARYSTNKNLAPEMVDEMRNAYSKCTKYLETKVSEVSEDNAKKYLQEQLLLAVGYKENEIERMELETLDNEQFQELLKNKVVGTITGNGSKQKVVREEEIEEYIEKGYEFQSALQNGKAVMKLPF